MVSLMFLGKPRGWFALTGRDILSYYAGCCFPFHFVGESALPILDVNPIDACTISLCECLHIGIRLSVPSCLFLCMCVYIILCLSVFYVSFCI